MFSFLPMAAAAALTAAVSAVAAAGLGVRAADTFHAALFRLIDIEGSTAKDQYKNHNNYDIFHNLTSFRSERTQP